jgi:hypothetical protein
MWRRVLLVLACSGCSLFNGSQHQGGGARPEPLFSSHTDYILHNTCAQPVEACWGTKERCAVIAPGEKRKLKGQNSGLPVRLKSDDASVTADSTFTVIEIGGSCKSLARFLPEAPPE